MRTLQLPFYARLALVLMSILMIYAILTAASGIFIPLTFALFFAVLLYPVARTLETRLHMGRALAAMCTVFTFMILLAGFIYFIVVQFLNFSDDFPLIRQRFMDSFDGLQHYIARSFHVNRRAQTDYLNKSAASIAESVAYSIRGIFFSLSTVVLYTIFILLFTFFILYHRKLLNRFVLHLFSPANRDKVREIIVETKSLINSYILALLIEMLIVGIVNCSVFMIMGIQYGLLLGIIAAFLNVVPYLGIYTSMAIIFLVTFANSGLSPATESIAALFVIHLLDANVLLPRLVGGRVKMNPFITILAVMVGEFIWGVPGMFLFIPIAGIIKLVCERVDGLEAWGILIGTEEKEKTGAKPVIKFIPTEN